MRLPRVWIAACVAVAGIVAVVDAGAADAGKACHRVELVDATTGAEVQGVEDIVLDREGGRLFLSAYDRWAVESAAGDDAEELPQGGIYLAALADVGAGAERLAVQNLTAGLSGAMHPHGIGYYRGGERQRLFAVNHAYGRGGGWDKRTRLDVFDVGEDGALAPAGRIEGPGLCNANDVAALSGKSALVTRDRDACGGVGRLAETVFGLRRAEVVLARLDEREGAPAPEPLIDGIGFANGIALAPDGRTLAVAATREHSVRLYDAVELLNGGRSPLAEIEVPGGPDNLGWRADGRLLAAVHPSLLRAGLARNRWLGRDRAASRVVEIAAGGNAVRTLVDDPDGELLNMATGIAADEDILVASGVLDSALLVCTAEAD